MEHERLLALCELSGPDLERQFRASRAGDMPAGAMAGFGCMLPRTRLSRAIAGISVAAVAPEPITRTDFGMVSGTMASL